jgi:hypothetical protein
MMPSRVIAFIARWVEAVSPCIRFPQQVPGASILDPSKIVLYFSVSQGR